MPVNRLIPAQGIAHDQRRFPRLFDPSYKVVVYWTTSADVVTLVGDYSSVSAANTARDGAVKANGAKPSVAVNWWHADMKHRGGGEVLHPDAREVLPAWYDEEPAT